MVAPSISIETRPKRPPRAVALAGPNGAGKSTVAEKLLRRHLETSRFVNADTIARGLDSFSPESVAIQAGRLMLDRIRKLAARNEDFGFETTLASRSFARWFYELESSGYDMLLFFLALPNPEMAIDRVAGRVRRGGHAVEPEVIRRRFHRGLHNLLHLYIPIATGWWVLDNTDPCGPRLIATKEPMDDTPTIVDTASWNQLRSMAHDPTGS